MNDLIEHPRVIPTRACFTGIGWLLQCVLSSTDSKNEPVLPDAISMATQRRSGREALAASVLFGLWTFLAVGCLIFEHTSLSSGVILLALFWLPAWLVFLHAVILLPPLVILPFAQRELAPARLEARQLLVTHAMVLATAWLLLKSAHEFSHALGLFWIALILLEICLRWLRSGLRLASRAK